MSSALRIPPSSTPPSFSVPRFVITQERQQRTAVYTVKRTNSKAAFAKVSSQFRKSRPRHAVARNATPPIGHSGSESLSMLYPAAAATFVQGVWAEPLIPCWYQQDSVVAAPRDTTFSIKPVTGAQHDIDAKPTLPPNTSPLVGCPGLYMHNLSGIIGGCPLLKSRQACAYEVTCSRGGVTCV